MRTDNSIGRS